MSKERAIPHNFEGENLERKLLRREPHSPAGGH